MVRYPLPMTTTITAPRAPSDWSRDYRRIEKAIAFIEENRERRPDLAEVARVAGLSEFHFQRLFSRMVGISPKRYELFLAKETAKDLLARSENVLDTAYESGLSGPGRLHDLFVTCEAVTPGEYRSRGAGLSITFGFHHSPFGEILLATTDRGICSLAFVEPGARRAAAASLREEWGRADLAEDQAATAPLARRIFESAPRARAPLSLYLRGTNFQVKVWEALLRIPRGAATTYEQVADGIGEAGAARAVGTAVGRNPVAFVIPCHRVLRKSGEMGGYHWGIARKRLILAWEAEKAAASVR
jgi:AraC family transcriptional regulator, regulatory protein of adaptative response / methylated-DNA-[protein]-cysteine methyltransferase